MIFRQDQKDHPDRLADAVEYAIPEWVDYFNRRHLERIGKVPPAKAKPTGARRLTQTKQPPWVFRAAPEKVLM